MHLQQAQCVEEVNLILGDPWLRKRIAEDDYTGHIPFSNSNHYLMIMKDGERIGVWGVRPMNGSTLEIHFSLLEGYQKAVIASGRLFLNWFVNESPDKYVKLSAQVPKLLPEIYNFAERIGFTEEGVNRLSYKKNGKLYDQWILGITRSEAKEWLGDKHD